MNKCPRPINTEKNDGSESWCKENGHCGCVPYSILRQKYGEALYPVSHTETLTCPQCGQPQVVKVIHTVPFHSYAHECSCGYWMENEG